MQSIAIIGSQWGDEGKGKITDFLSEKSDVVVRYQGGNNAGHTILVKDKQTILHIIPSGILHQHCTSVIGHGVVFDPNAFIEETEMLKKSGVKVTPKNLKISQNCNVITAYHRLLDGQREEKSSTQIGTTGRGIGPAYEDKFSRRGLKLIDLFDKKRLEKRLTENFREKEVLFKNLYQTSFPSIEEEVERLYQMGQVVKPYSCDTFSFLESAFSTGKKVLYEGAQGILLDIDYGSYPFVTSSNTSIGGIFTGIGPFNNGPNEIIGITKAYTTRVGEGPFPTELKDEIGELIRLKGGEFGATTGRPRRCGWIDLPLLKYSVKATNLTSLALTKLDVLSKIKTLKVCYAYEYQGKEINCAYPGIDLSQVKPLFKEIAPFTDNFQDGQISPELENYIGVVEEATQIPVGILAYGPERSQIMFRKKYFH